MTDKLEREMQQGRVIASERLIMRYTKLRPLTAGRRIAWYASSLAFAATVLLLGTSNGWFADRETRAFPVTFAVLIWAVVTYALRLFLRDADAPDE